METATEYWTKRFGKPPKKDSEKLAVAMMAEYADHLFEDENKDPYSYWPQCDVQGCKGVSSSGGSHWRDTGYWSICSKHGDECRKRKPQPKMKDAAIKREKSRLPDGRLA